MISPTTALIEELGTKPIADIAKKLGGWPVIEGGSWNADDSWTWQETVKKFRRVGFSMDYIIDFSVSVDLKNSTKRIIDVSLFNLILVASGCFTSFTYHNSLINQLLA